MKYFGRIICSFVSREDRAEKAMLKAKEEKELKRKGITAKNAYGTVNNAHD